MELMRNIDETYYRKEVDKLISQGSNVITVKPRLTGPRLSGQLRIAKSFKAAKEYSTVQCVYARQLNAVGG